MTKKAAVRKAIVSYTVAATLHGAHSNLIFLGLYNLAVSPGDTKGEMMDMVMQYTNAASQSASRSARALRCRIVRRRTTKSRLAKEMARDNNKDCAKTERWQVADAGAPSILLH